MEEFGTVEDYYLWGSQGNSFAPIFDGLSDTARQKWAEDFEEYKQKHKLNNKES